ATPRRQEAGGDGIATKRKKERVRKRQVPFHPFRSVLLLLALGLTMGPKNMKKREQDQRRAEKKEEKKGVRDGSLLVQHTDEVRRFAGADMPSLFFCCLRTASLPSLSHLVHLV